MTSPIHLTIAPGDDAPIYRQIVRQIREALVGGRLRPGDRLPSHRELATRLRINRNTAVAAYRHLEESGAARGHTGRCTFLIRQDGKLLSTQGNVVGLEIEKLSALIAGVMGNAREMADLLSEENFAVLFSQDSHRRIYSELIDDDILGTFAVVGAPETIAPELGRRYSDVIHRISFYAPYESDGDRWGAVMDGIKAI